MLVSLNLEIIRNTVQKGTDQGEHGSHSRVIHDKEVLTELFVRGMDDLGVDVVRDCTPKFLVTVVVLSGGGIGFQDTQDDGIDHGEGTGGEEALSSCEETVISYTQITLEQGKSNSTHKRRISRDTNRRNQLVLLGTIRK